MLPLLLKPRKLTESEEDGGCDSAAAESGGDEEGWMRLAIEMLGERRTRCLVGVCCSMGECDWMDGDDV